MDPTGLLDGVLAVAIYPGVGFLAVAALLHALLAGRGPGGRTPGPVPAASLVPVLAASVATAMLPMVGAPGLRLPPSGGVAGNVIAIVVLLAVAVELGARSSSASRLAACAALPVVALAAATGSVSAVAVVTAGGVTGVAARILAACLLVLAGSVASAGRAASTVCAALALAGAALVLPAALRDAPPAVCAVASLGMVALSGLMGRWRGRWSLGTVTMAGVAGMVAATALALLSARV